MKAMRCFFWVFPALSFLLSFSLEAQTIIVPDVIIDPVDESVEFTYTGDDASYYVVSGGSDLVDFSLGRAISLGAVGEMTLRAEFEEGQSKFFYILRQIPLTSPEDQDQDEIDDLFELQNPTILDPLRSIDAFFDSDTDGVNNVTEYRNGTSITVPDGMTFEPAMVTETAPFDGEEMVSTTRQIVVRFSDRIDRETVTASNFMVEANGSQVSGRREISATEKFITFFLDAPLSPSTEVRVTVRGDSIMSRSGEALDADSDGVAGGTLTVNYRTLPLSVISGTNVFGFVYDSMRKTDDGSPLPIAGVTIRLDALPITAVTDADGRFDLIGVPAPEFFAHIDGSTVPNPPAGRQYPVIGKAFHSTPGQTVQVNHAGEVFDIYLPAMSSDDVTDLSMTGVTEVGFGSGAMADLKEILPGVDETLFEEMKLMVPPGSAKSDDGEFANQVSIIAVPPDRTPSPLPPMAVPPVVISIQAGQDGAFNGAEGGTTNFDIPVPVAFPNLEGAAPGTKQSIFSFDHDAGDWVNVGLGTVSADGRSIVADEGVGIVAPGWHFPDPWTRWRGDRPRPPRRTPRPPRPPRPPNPPIDNPPNQPPPPGPGNDAPGPPPGTGSPGGPGDPGSTPGTPSGPGLPGGDDDCYFLVAVIVEGKTPRRFLTDRDGLFYCYLTPNTDYTLIVYDPKTGRIWKTTGTSGAAGTPTDFGDYDFGTPDPTDADNNGVPDDVDQVLGRGVQFDFGTAASPVALAHLRVTDADSYDSAKGYGWTNGSITSLDRSSNSSALNRDFCTSGNATFSVDLAAGLYDVTLFFGDETQERLRQEVSLEGLLRAAVSTTAGQFATSRHTVLVEDGQLSVEVSDAALNGLHITAINNADALFDTFPDFNPAGFYYVAIEDLQTGFILRNLVNLSEGEQLCGAGVDLAPNEPHRQTIYHVDSGWMGVSDFITSPIGRPGNMPELVLLPPTGSPDSDGDGIPDLGEFAIGSNPSKADTDEDGINDLIDIVPPNSPFDARSFPTGLISLLDLMGEGRDVIIDGDLAQSSSLTAYVATGSHGLAIVDVSQLDNPIVLGQLDLEGTAIRVATDQALGFAAVACEGEGVHLVDISDPMAPVLVRTIPVAATALCYYNGNLYVGTDTGIQSYGIARSSLGLGAEALETLELPSAVTDLAREHQSLYVMRDDRRLQIIDISGFAMIPRGILQVQETGGRIFAGGGTVYAVSKNKSRGGHAVVDVMDPDAPTLITLSDTVPPFVFPKEDIAFTGSGIGVLVGNAGTQDISVINNADPTVTNSLLVAFDSVTMPQAVAVASGLAFVTSQTGGLSVYNYLSFDTQGMAPEVSIDTTMLDIDENTDGVQLQEGSVVPIIVDIVDDVQIRDAQLLLDGVPVTTDVSFPYDFFVNVPALSSGQSQLNVQVRGTDTGGNVTTSDPLMIDIVPDTVPPTIINLTPEDGITRGQNFTSVRIDFSEPMDQATLTSANVEVTSGGAVVPPEMVTIQSFGQRLQLTFPGFTPGEYNLNIDQAQLTDVAGNPLGTGVSTTSFTILEADAVFAAAEGGFWDVATNWDSGLVPAAGDDIFLALPDGAEVTIRSGNFQVRSLTGTSPVNLEGGVLDVETFIQLDADLTLNGGVLKNAQVLPGANGECLNVLANRNNVLDNVTLDCDVLMNVPNAHFTIENGLELNSVITMQTRSSISFRGDEMISGTGEVFFSNESGQKEFEAVENDTTLTIGSGIVLSGSRARLIGSLYFGRRGSLVNDGTIVGSIGGPNINININTTGGTFTNNGTLRVENSGAIRIGNLAGDLGAVELQSQGTLQIDGGNYVVDQPLVINADEESVILGGTWQNTGGITLSNGNLTLGGPLIFSDLGTITRSGGTVTFSGDLDLAGETLALDDTTGPWRVFDGVIRNGTYTSTGAGQLQFGNHRGNILDNMILNGETAMTEPSAHLRFDNGLELNGTITMTSRSSIAFTGDETLSGTGSIFFDASNNNSKEVEAFETDSTLTIGSGITMSGSRARLIGSLYYGRRGSIINEGTITADSPNGEIVARTAGGGVFTNSGTLNATNGGTLRIENLQGNLDMFTVAAESTLRIDGGTYVSDLPLTIDQPGSNVSFGGSWQNTGGVTLSDGNFTIAGPTSLADLGTITRTGGTVTFSGDLDLEGGTLALDDITGPWRVFDGVIRNGTYTSTGTGELQFGNHRGNILDNMIFDGDTTMTEPSAHLRFDNGLELNGTITMTSRSSIAFTGNETMSGTGSIFFDTSNNNSKEIEAFETDSTLTIGSGITMSGSRARLIGSLYYGRRSSIINEGTITANSPNGEILVRSAGGGTFMNSGSLNAIGGGTLRIENFQGGLGSVNVNAESSFIINAGTYTSDTPISINGENANVTFGGSWQNTAGINLTDGNFTISGPTTLADLGSITRTGGTVTFSGDLDLAGQTLALNDTTGPWRVFDGIIRNGTFTSEGTGQLQFANRSGNILDNMVLNGDITMSEPSAHFRFDNGLELNSTITMTSRSAIGFMGNETISGTGSIIFDSSNNNSKEIESFETDGILTIGSGITMSGSRARLNGSLFSGRRGSIINEGTITANSSNGEILIRTAGGGTFTNNGNLNMLNEGTLRIENLQGNMGAISVAADSTFDIDGGTYLSNLPLEVSETGSNVIFGGTWQNTGGITLSDGSFTIGGPTTLADLGTITRTGGILTFSGNLDLAGGTLALDDTTGPWRVFDGVIRNGTYTSAGTGQLVFTGRSANRLDSMIVDGDIVLTEPNAYFRFDNGLELNGTVTMTSRSGIGYVGNETITGTGNIVADTSNNNVKDIEAIETDTILTIGSGITISGSRLDLGGSLFSGRRGSIINEGAIIATSSNDDLYLQTEGGTFENRGTLTATAGGTLRIRNLTGNLGSTNIDAASSLDIVGGTYVIDQALSMTDVDAALVLGGSWQNNGGVTLADGNLTLGGETTLTDLGTITRTGGVVTVSGSLDLGGQTLTLNDATGPWRVFDGTIRNGTYAGSGTGVLSFAGRNTNRLDNMTVDGDIVLTETNAFFGIDNGLVLNGTVNMNVRSSIGYVGNETISGTGSIVFDTVDTGRKEIEALEHDTTLTVENGITITGGRGRIIGSLFFGRRGSMINRGNIVADGGEVRIATTGGTFRNEGAGSTSEVNGGTIVIDNPAP